MFGGVIGVFEPAVELLVEFGEFVGGLEVASEELIPNGAKEAFDLAFGGSVSNRCVDEQGAEAGTDGGEFLGDVVGAVCGAAN